MSLGRRGTKLHMADIVAREWEWKKNGRESGSRRKRKTPGIRFRAFPNSAAESSCRACDRLRLNRRSDGGSDVFVQGLRNRILGLVADKLFDHLASLEHQQRGDAGDL